MSLTFLGLVIAGASWLAVQVGFPFSVNVDQLLTTVFVIGQFVGLVIAYVGRVRKGDITWYGTHKTL